MTIIFKYTAWERRPTSCKYRRSGVCAFLRNFENSSGIVLKMYGFRASSNALQTSRRGNTSFLSHLHMRTFHSRTSSMSSWGRESMAAEWSAIDPKGFKGRTGTCLFCRGAVPMPLKFEAIPTPFQLNSRFAHSFGGWVCITSRAQPNQKIDKAEVDYVIEASLPLKTENVHRQACLGSTLVFQINLLLCFHRFLVNHCSLIWTMAVSCPWLPCLCLKHQALTSFGFHCGKCGTLIRFWASEGWKTMDSLRFFTSKISTEESAPKPMRCWNRMLLRITARDGLFSWQCIFLPPSIILNEGKPLKDILYRYQTIWHQKLAIRYVVGTPQLPKTKAILYWD